MIISGILDLFKNLLKLVFPIGSTYITQNRTNPNSILGFGTWERLKGKVCLGVDEDDINMNVIGETGGEKTHVLTESEMPRHRHRTAIEDSESSTNVDYAGYGYGKGKYYNPTEYTGEGQAHNNMPPYEIVGFMWIRRA